MKTISMPTGRVDGERIWLDSYPASMPAELPPFEFESLGALFDHSCATYAERHAFSSMDAH